MTNYRFYLLNRHDHITDVHIAECDGIDDLQRKALSLLAEHVAAATVEAWDRDRLIYRSERPKSVPVGNSAA